LHLLLSLAQEVIFEQPQELFVFLRCQESLVGGNRIPLSEDVDYGRVFDLLEILELVSRGLLEDCLGCFELLDELVW
jgi:hypothetical protein